MSVDAAVRSELDYRFERGRLLLRRGRFFHMIVDPWPHPRAWTETIASGRRPCVPDFRLVGPRARSSSAKQLAFPFGVEAITESGVEIRGRPSRSWITQRKRAFDHLRAALPPAVVEGLLPFRRGQWRILELVAHDPDALDLVRSSPALAGLLAHRVDGDHRLLRAASFGRRRQKEILRWLGLPATKSMRRLLRRLDVAVVEGADWRHVVAALGPTNPALQRRLRHVEAVNVGVVTLLGTPELAELASPRLLDEVAHDPRERRRALAAEAIFTLLELDPDRLPAGPIASRDRLDQLVAEAIDAHERRIRAAHAARAAGLHNFQRPPLPAVRGVIEPLDTPEKLADEGLAQRHCAGIYANHVAQGRRYLYRVLRPERATLALEQDDTGAWHIKQLLGRCNREVRLDTWLTVEAWVDRHRASREQG